MLLCGVQSSVLLLLLLRLLYLRLLSSASALDEHLVIENVTLSFDVECDWSRLTLDLALQIIIIRSFHTWLEGDVNGEIGERLESAWDRCDTKGVSVLRVTLNGFLFEGESYGHFLQILEIYCFFVATTNQQRTEIDLAHIEEYIGFNDWSNDEEVLSYFVLSNLEDPIWFVCSNNVRCILKSGLKLLTREYNSFGSETFEEAFTTESSATVGSSTRATLCWSLLVLLLYSLWELVFFNTLPLELIALRSWVNNVEFLCIFDLSSKTLELYDIGVWVYVWLFFAVFWWRR